MCVCVCNMGVRKSFSHAEGGDTKCFQVDLTHDPFCRGGSGHKSFHPFKTGGGGHNKFFCLVGGNSL